MFCYQDGGMEEREIVHHLSSNVIACWIFIERYWPAVIPASLQTSSYGLGFKNTWLTVQTNLGTPIFKGKGDFCAR